MTPEEKKTLIEHLETQYKIYRDEVRSDMGFIAASPSVLAALLVGELVVAKDKPEALLTIPLTVLAYGSFLGILFSFLSAVAKYAELVEKRINLLLQEEAYIYEQEYGGVDKIEGQLVPMTILGILVAILPIAVTAYAIYRIGWVDNVQIYFSPKTLAYSLSGVMVVGTSVIFWATVTMINLAKNKNVRVLAAIRAEKKEIKSKTNPNRA